jgi:3-phenylpropionate/cinnamic acid dioxygenase small subunit
MSTGELVDQATHWEIQRFLTAEARLLDDRRFDEWLALFTEDCRYWVPVRGVRSISSKTGERDIERELSADGEPYILDETRVELQIRISRIHTARMLWCENPPSRVRHLIGNVEAWHVEEGYRVLSNFALFQARFDQPGVTFFGERHDLLRRVAGGLRIVRRKVILDSAVIPTGAVTVFF